MSMHEKRFLRRLRRPPSGRSNSSARQSLCRLSVALVCGVVFFAQSAAADLVVLVGGPVMKVRSYELDGERVRLYLQNAGTVTLPLTRIEKVVDDEIVPVEEQISDGLGLPPIDFRDGQTAPNTPFGEMILESSRRFALNPDLVAAIVRTESNFDPEAISPKGARGLMQVMPATASRFGVEPGDLYDPEQNLLAGIRYLEWLRGRFDDNLTYMLAAYNAGEGNVDRHGGVPPFRETHNYLRRVYSVLGVTDQVSGR